MHDFQYKNGELCCEEVPVKSIAQRVGTPFYLYSSNTLVNHFGPLTAAFAGVPRLICYALKSNSNGAVLRLLGREGAGADIVSGGELFRALRAGIDPEEDRLRRRGQAPGRDRVCPQGPASSCSTSSRAKSFRPSTRPRERDACEGGDRAPGQPEHRSQDPRLHFHGAQGEQVRHSDRARRWSTTRRPGPCRTCEIVGVHHHIGSQITEVGPFVEALEKVAGFVTELRAAGMNIAYIDIGGGLGITYKDETPPQPRELAAAIRPRPAATAARSSSSRAGRSSAMPASS